MKKQFQSLTEKGRWLLATLTLIFTLGIGQMWAADPIENVGTYSTQVISADRTTSTWTFITPGSQVTIPTSPAETEDNDIIFHPGGGSKMKFSSSNGFSWSGNSDGYIPVPSGAAGSISMTVKSASDSRWLQLYVAGESAGSTKRLWSKEANPATEARGPRTFTFTSSDLTTKGGKTYLHLRDNNTELKIATITVTLTTGTYGSSTPDETAPTLSSSDPANSATGVAVEGTIVLTFSEAIASVDGSKFTLDGATKGIVAIDGTDSKKVNVPYSGAANSATVTLSVAAEAVADAAGNKSAALSNIAFTTIAAITPACPSGISISGTTAYTEGETISLEAALSEGNGEITYKWYKGADLATAKAAGSIGTGASFSKASCVTGDAGNYYCVASKDGCLTDAESSAYAITVAAVSYCAELYPATSGASPTGKNQELLLQSEAPNASYGGKIYTAGAKDNNWSASFTYTANGLQLNKGGADSARVELNHLMQVGTVITATLVNPDASKARGFKLLNMSKTVKATWQAQTTEPQTYTYTVVAGDGLAGTNMFLLNRAESSALKELKVSNCGAELLALTSAVSVTGKATVTLSKSLVATGGSATASYSDIDAAYEFDGWEITTGDATIADPSAATAAITMGTTASTITLKLKAAEEKYTVTYYDGEESMGTEQVLKDGHPTATGIATRKLGYTFQGWSLTSGGAVKALNEITVTEAMPLYAVYAPVVCPTKGTVFSMSVTDAANTEYNENNAFGLEIGATYTLGIAYSGSKSTTKRVGVIDTNGEYSFSNNGDVTVKIALDCALAEGDVISFTSTSSKQLKIQKVAGTDLYTTSSKSFTIPAESPLIGESVFYLMRDNSGSTFKTITISRPYTVSFNLNGQSATAIADQKVVAGGKVTEPTAPSVTGQAFGGWYKEAACTNAWDFATDVVNDDVELFAKWTALPKMTLNAGTGTGDDVVSYPAVGSAVAVPECPTGFEKTGYIFAGWVYSPSVTVEAGQFTMPNEDLTLTAQWDEANKVAKIGDVKYETLEDALLHAADGTIELLQDINVEAQVEIADGVTATIDLAGHKIEYTSATTLPSGVILVHNGGSLTINDSSDPDAGSVVAGEKAYAALMLTKAGDDASKVANLTINGGSFTGYYYAISGNGNRPNTNITINGGTFTATAANDNLAIYHPQNGTLTINGGSFVGYLSAIEMRAGSLVISDGSFTATAPTFSCNAAGSGTTTQGAAIAIAQHTTKKDIEVTINGGTFTGVKALNESNPQANDPAPQVTMAVTAGTFTGEVSTVDVDKFVSGGSFSEPVAEANCATGYVPETKANGKYGVIVPAQSIDFEAIIDTYGTDATAIAELDAQLAAKHYDIDGTLNDDRLDAPSGKPADKGFKVKKTDLTISFSVEAGKVVEITTGNLSGASIKVDDAAAEAMTASHTHTYYSDDAQAFLITMTAASNKYNIFKSIVIRDPYQVTLDATTNGGEAVAPMYGKLSVILPSATKGTDHFIGWYDRAEEEGRVLVGLADAEYTPTADVTLYAHFAAQSNDATLASWEIDGVDTPVPTEPGNLIHRIEVPYGTAVANLPKITAAVAHDATYAQSVVIYPTDGPEWQAGIDGGCYVQQVIVTAEDGTQGFYHVRTKVLPKDMACLVWADVPSANTLTYNASKSLLPEDAVTLAINNVSGTDGPAGVKFQKKGYIKIEMNEGTFQAGDVVALDVTGAAGSTMHVFKVQTPSSEADVIGTGEGTTTPVGVNKVAITEDAAALYLARPNDGTYNGWNPHVDYVAVYRAYPNPLVNTITFNGAAGTVDNDLKTITVEVPASTDFGTMPVVATFLSNDPSQTNGAVTGGAWAEGDNEYVVTDKDNDQTVYTVTISKAVASNDATLSALSYGGTAISLTDGVYEYNVELPYGTSDVPALAATAHHAGASVTNIADAAAFINRHATSTVTVTAEDGTSTQVYTVNFAVSRYESKLLWDGSTMSALSDITAAAAAAGVSITTTGVSVTSFSAKTCEENGKSYTKALDFGGKTQSTRNFGIVIPAGKVAKVSVVYRAKSTGRSIMIATALSDAVNESTITSKEAVDGSNLYIMTADMFGGGTLYINTTDGYHVHEISLQLADGYARSAMLGNGVLGTVCVDHNVNVADIQGVTVYELMGRENTYGKLAFDEIISGELEAGAPYVFQAHGNHMALLYGETSVAEPVDKGNGMYGTFVDQTLTELNDIYYFAQRALWSCVDLTELSLPANRAYVKLSEVDYLSDPNPAPGRRRITMNVNGEKIVTGVENLNASEQPVKLLINGQIFILRGEKLFDATGKLVK